MPYCMKSSTTGSYLIDAFSGLPRQVWLLALVNFINRSGGMVLCFLTLYLTEKLHYSIVDAGYAMSFFGIGAVGGSLLGGRLTDTFGYRIVQLVTLTATGFSFIWLLFVHDFWWFCLALFCCSLVSEAFRPANAVAIRMNSSPENRTRAYSLMRLAFNLAISIALVFGGWLITKGWSFIFCIDSATCFLAATALYYFLPKMKQGEKQRETVEHAPGISLNTIPKTNNLELEKTSARVSPYGDSTYLLFVVLTFFSALVFMQIIWTIPAFFKQTYHWSEWVIGAVSAVNGVVVMLVEMPLVFGIEGKRSNLWFIRFGIFLYAVCYAALLLPFEYRWFAALFYMTIISFGEILAMPFSTTWITKRSPIHAQGQYLALYGVAYSLANIAAPVFGTQIIAAYGYSAFWSAITVIALATAAGFYFLQRSIETAPPTRKIVYNERSKNNL